MLEIDYPRLEEARKNFKTPNNMTDLQTSVDVLRQSLSPWLINRLEALTQDPERIQRELASIQNGTPLSRASRCASFVHDFEAPVIYEKSQKELDANQIGSFIVFYDLAKNIQDDTVAIYRAEGALSKGVPAEALSAFGEYIKEPNISAQEAEQLLARSAEKFGRYVDLLIGNSSGQHLIDYQAHIDLNDLFGFPTRRPRSQDGYSTAVSLLATLYTSEVYRFVYPLSK